MTPEAEMKPREAAQRLGIGLDYLYRLIWSGKISARKDEYGRWWIPLSSLASREAMTEAKGSGSIRMRQVNSILP